MGQMIARLNEKLITGVDRPNSKQQECKNMLGDLTQDEVDFDESTNITSDHQLETPDLTKTKSKSKSKRSKKSNSFFNLNSSNSSKKSNKTNYSANDKTPKHLVKLRCDPRSPSNFDRTPLKVTLEDDLKDINNDSSAFK